jgi:4-diphosphocytidyl-2-C-methyl-D-erythritol kinase
MKILTPAKINPLLYILGKRKDGFHELYMHMVPVSLFDKLSFSNNNKKGLIFQIKGATFSEPMEDNLVVRAVRLFEEATGVTADLDIVLEKYIPSGAGLGGGSGNAAGTLRALNNIFRLSSTSAVLLPPERLFELALELGSDVPFFLEPSPCEIRGRGDKLIPLKEYPEFFLVIIKPNVSISTPDAYLNCLPEKRTSFPKVKSFTDLKIHLNNQFEISLLSQYPLLSELKSLLLQNGAFGALVSGSGSAVFGLFNKKILQIQAFKNLSCLQIGEIFYCETLTTHRYY